jgi:transposase
MEVIEFPQLIERGCGLDVHKETVVATIKGIGVTEQTQTFGTFTGDLERLVGWLQNEGITHIAMESTGVYWKPVYSMLEEYFEILVVNARHIKNVPGHKTDKKDSEWIAKLLLSGLLKGSFIPCQGSRELRVLFRHRKKLIGQRSAEKNRLQGILEDANIKLACVVSDVFGKTGTAIVKALSQGETDPVKLSHLARGSLIGKRDQLQLALYGRVTSHHQFMLTFILGVIDQINAMINTLDQRIETYMTNLEESIGLLHTIPGVSYHIAMGIIAEIGTTMETFPTHKHLASWAGICPGSNESAGKKRSSKVTHGNKYLKTILVEAAWAASHTKGTVLADTYHRIAKRRGRKRANLALGHKILSAAYFILRDRIPYRNPNQNPDVIAQRKAAKIKRLEKQLKKLKK